VIAEESGFSRRDRPRSRLRIELLTSSMLSVLCFSFHFRWLLSVRQLVESPLRRSLFAGLPLLVLHLVRTMTLFCSALLHVHRSILTGLMDELSSQILPGPTYATISRLSHKKFFSPACARRSGVIGLSFQGNAESEAPAITQILANSKKLSEPVISFYLSRSDNLKYAASLCGLHYVLARRSGDEPLTSID
jgi:hypothetical protein